MSFCKTTKIRNFSSPNADMDTATGWRVHLHPHPQSKKWMDAGGFVDADTATGGLALSTAKFC
jgi:hypothetical protein